MKYGNLARNLTLLRTEKNLPAVQLSFELNFQTGRIGDIENSRKIAIKQEEIDIIARYFDIDVDTLVNKIAYVAFK